MLRQRRLLAGPQLSPPFGPATCRLVRIRRLRLEGERDADESGQTRRRLERHIRSHSPLELTDQARTDRSYGGQLRDGQAAPFPGGAKRLREQADCTKCQ